MTGEARIETEIVADFRAWLRRPRDLEATETLWCQTRAMVGTESAVLNLLSGHRLLTPESPPQLPPSSIGGLPVELDESILPDTVYLQDADGGVLAAFVWHEGRWRLYDMRGALEAVRSFEEAFESVRATLARGEPGQ